MNLALAAAGALIFLTLFITSGRIAAGDGLGWDGRGYASLMTDGLDQGSVATRSRPLLPFLTRIPYSLGLDVIQSFQAMNAIYAFILYLFVALILDHYGVQTRFKVVVIANLALCIATSKMFAYYPVLIDLGALALVTAAFYFTITDRHGSAGVVCLLAVASREFAAAAVLCGLHRTLRQRRWPAALWYVPAIVIALIMRATTTGEGALQVARVADATMQYSLLVVFWRSPMLYGPVFAYFVLTVFGGMSVLLLLHPRWCGRRLREQPEQATFLVAIVGLTVIGLDMWRYLMFALPVAVALIAQFYRDRLSDARLERPIAAAMLFATVITQRPFERMDPAIYFREWFPQYDVLNGVASPDLLALWGMRLTALILIMVVFASITRSRRVQEPAS
ncbi:MAG TPA: hypothetical protein VMS40_12190 [Vicinamibacterales bacterium]|nr:hypothetical protein [Vicinamibacterales bacterium]